MSDYYNLLGIAENASASEIRSAYRRLARQVHPDVHPHLSPRERESMRHRFIRLTQAYETLRDPTLRAGYDRQLQARRATARRPTQGPAGSQRGSQAARQSQARPASPDRDNANSAGPDATGPSLEELLSDTEALLDRFGLDLRQPVEAVLEALWAWAVEIYREVAGLNEGADSDPTRPAKNPNAGSREDPRPRARSTTKEDPAVEAELRALKAAMRRKS